MENTIMNAGLISLVILAVVGFVKLPLGKFKESHSNWFKATLTAITFVLTVGAVAISQLYIVGEPLFGEETLLLLIATLSGVFVTYNGIYEGFAVKKLAKTLWENLKTLWTKRAVKDSKIEKFVNKVGIENIDRVMNSLVAETNKEVVEVTESEITNA